MPSENWQAIPPEELVELKPGEPVVVRLEQWEPRKQRKEVAFRSGLFESYSPSRGIVNAKLDVSFKSIPGIVKENFDRFDFRHGIWVNDEFCDNTIGRYAAIEHHELHADNGSYDE
jgi:hypothetical protein